MHPLESPRGNGSHLVSLLSRDYSKELVTVWRQHVRWCDWDLPAVSDLSVSMGILFCVKCISLGKQLQEPTGEQG